MADIDQKLILELAQMLLVLIRTLLLFDGAHDGQCKVSSSNHSQNHGQEKDDSSNHAGNLQLLICNECHCAHRAYHKIGPGNCIRLPSCYLKHFMLPSWHHLKC